MHHETLNAPLESFAQACGRPLIYLTVADIGLKEDSIEANLERWFKLAETWRAFLLIDEADVFMERRQLADLTRNSLVAGENTKLLCLIALDTDARLRSI